MNRLRAGAAAAVVAIATGIALGTLTAAPGSTSTHLIVGWGDAGAPRGTECIWATGTATKEAIAQLPPLSSSTTRYARTRVCTPPSDAGEPSLPPGMDVLRATESVEPFDGGQPRLEIWLQGDPAAPWLCACSTGSECSVPLLDGGTGPAPTGITLRQWSGAGCVTKPCIQWAGISSWPSACPGGG